MPADGFVSTAKLDHRLVLNEAMQLLQVQELFGFDDESNECTICWAAPKDVILLPCRHINMCYSCLRNNVRKCPVCRCAILNYLRFQDVPAPSPK